MKILLADKVSPTAKKVLEDAGFAADLKPGLSEEELVSIMPEYDAMIVRSGVNVTKNIIDAGDKLKIIGRAGVGFDNIDTQAAKEKGIAVMNTPLGNVNAAAEHTLTMLMLLAKHVIHAHIELKKGIWDRKKYTGIELKGKTIGITGLGHVGRKVAKVALALEMKVIGFDPFLDKEKMKAIGVEKVELDELMKQSDFITVHVPKIKETTNLIDKKQFEMMKKGVRILNVARGGIISEEALHDAVESGKVAAAAIDVWEKEPPGKHPFLEHENIIVTPHLGASTVEAQENVAIDVASQIVKALKEGKLENVVNGVAKIRKC